MKNITWKHRLLILITSGLSLLILCTASNAEEGGSGHYAPGGVATMIDLAPTQPGWIVQPLYLHYEGNASASKTLPIAGVIAGELDATIDALTLGGFYTFEKSVLGAHYSVGAYIPYMWMDATATVSIGPNTLAPLSDSVDGIGDITIIPAALAWKYGSWQFNALLPVYAPTGDYKVGRLANTGLNYWTFDPTVGVAYNNPKNGFNFALHTGVTINTENSDTDYTSGSVLHVEVSAQQLLPLGKGFIGIGFNGFLYEQISGDDGSGATQGDFKGRSMGIGPVLSYILPTKSGTGVLEVRWLPELDTENRVEGDYIWVKAAWQF